MSSKCASSFPIHMINHVIFPFLPGHVIYHPSSLAPSLPGSPLTRIWFHKLDLWLLKAANKTPPRAIKSINEKSGPFPLTPRLIQSPSGGIDKHQGVFCLGIENVFILALWSLPRARKWHWTSIRLTGGRPAFYWRFLDVLLEEPVGPNFSVIDMEKREEKRREEKAGSRF